MTGMKLERGMGSGKQCCQTGTLTRECMKMEKDVDR